MQWSQVSRVAAVACGRCVPQNIDHISSRRLWGHSQLAEWFLVRLKGTKIVWAVTMTILFSLSADLKYVCQRIFLDFTHKICKLASLKPANSWETCWEISHIMLDKCEKVEIGSLMWRPSNTFTNNNHMWNGKSWRSTIKPHSSITILRPVFIRL